MSKKALNIFIVLSLGLMVAQKTNCNYGGNQNQYSQANDIYDKKNGYSSSGGYGSSDGEGGGYGYGDEGEGGGGGRPRIKLNFGVHVPAMKIQLPRMNLPKITIKAKLKQPNRPSTINIPEINLETQSKVSPPGNKDGGDSSYGGQGGFGGQGGYDQASYGGQSGYGGNGEGGSYEGKNNGYDQKMEGYASYSGYSASSSSYQPSGYGSARSYGANNGGGTTYLTASNDGYGTSAISLSNSPENSNGNGGYGGNGHQRYNYDNGNNNNLNYQKYQFGDRMRSSSNYDTTNSGNNEHGGMENYRSASTNKDVINEAQNQGAIQSSYDHRLAANKVSLNFPERIISDHQTYQLDQSRSSSMIEPQLTDEVVAKPVHLVYSAIHPIPDNHNHQQQLKSYQRPHQYRFVTNGNRNDNYYNNNLNGQESRSFIHKISAPFVQMRDWFRPSYRA